MLKPQVYGKYDRREDDYVSIDTNDIDTLSLSHLAVPIDLEALYARSPGARIVNNENMIASSLSQEFCDAIYSNNDGDIGFVPACDCGALYGRYNEGSICTICKTKVSTAFVDKLTHMAWLGIPAILAPVLHPVWYFVLKNWTVGTKSSGAIIDVILNPMLEVPDILKPICDKGRGFRFFYDNADAIFKYLFEEVQWNAGGRRKMEWIKLFYQQYRSVMFTTKLPILHSSLHPLISNGASMKLADSSSKNILAAIHNLTALTFMETNAIATRKSLDVTMYDLYKKVITYYESIIHEKVGSKPACIRHHVLGSRLHWTYRTVCIPRIGPHQADEIEMPYKLMVSSFKLQIINYLVHRRHYTVRDALSKQIRAFTIFDQDVYDILMEIMHDSPWKGIPATTGRNPTLRLLSTELFFITHIKKDIRDETIGISPLVISTMNADFDGDALWGIFILETDMVNDLMAIHPREAMLAIDSPCVATDVTLTDQAMVNFHKWLHYVDNSFEPMVLPSTRTQLRGSAA